VSRVIVRIGERQGALSAWLEKAVGASPQARQPQQLGLTAGTLVAPATAAEARAYGDRVRAALSQHAEIAPLLNGIFQAGGGRSATLYFEIEAQAAEELRWECLADPAGSFVAVTGACHIARIAEETSSQEAGVRPFAPPLRLAGFLSALGERAAAEWTALTAAVRAEAAAGVAIVADVYIGEPALLALAQAECEAAAGTGDRSVRALPLPADAMTIEQQLQRQPPHILHFFCHGSAAMGASFLTLATLAEHTLVDNGIAAEASIVIPIDELIRWAGLRQTWLVTLNCCQGAAPSEQLYSMAYRLVSQGGVAAAIGMHEPVTAAEASRFCRAVYPPLLAALRPATNGAAQPPLVTLELASAMAPARRALSAMYPGAKANGRWTLPVLYTQDRLLEVYRLPVASAAPLAPAAPVAPVSPAQQQPAQAVSVAPAAGQQMLDMADRVRTVAGWLRALPPDAPDELRERGLDLLDLAPPIPAEIRPDRLGQFGQVVAEAELVEAPT